MAPGVGRRPLRCRWPGALPARQRAAPPLAADFAGELGADSPSPTATSCSPWQAHTAADERACALTAACCHGRRRRGQRRPGRSRWSTSARAPGLGLRLDAYHYRYTAQQPARGSATADAPVTLETELRRPRTPPLPPRRRPFAWGSRSTPSRSTSPTPHAARGCTRARRPWQEALARFDLAGDQRPPATAGDRLTSDTLKVCAAWSSGAPRRAPVPNDAYVHVFFTALQQRAASATWSTRLGTRPRPRLDLARPAGADGRRPAGERARGRELPPGLLERARHGGRVRRARAPCGQGRQVATTRVLGLGHPGGAWLEWLA